eukprot:9529357-Prorocentrum_lima.AAC.1
MCIRDRVTIVHQARQTDVRYTICGSRARMLALHFACKKKPEWQQATRQVQGQFWIVTGHRVL